MCRISVQPIQRSDHNGFCLNRSILNLFFHAVVFQTIFCESSAFRRINVEFFNLHIVCSCILFYASCLCCYAVSIILCMGTVANISDNFLHPNFPF